MLNLEDGFVISDTIKFITKSYILGCFCILSGLSHSFYNIDPFTSTPESIGYKLCFNKTKLWSESNTVTDFYKNKFFLRVWFLGNFIEISGTYPFFFMLPTQLLPSFLNFKK